MIQLYKKTSLIFKTLALAATVLLIPLKSIATIHTITVQDFNFNPSILTVNVGDTILWQWVNGVHTTTSTSIPSGANAWNSPIQQSNPLFAYIVQVPGTYNYVCQPHAPNMAGSFTANTTVGITPKPGSKEMGVSIYPNPVERYVTIDFKNIPASHRNIKIEVYDIIGNQYHDAEYRVTKDDMKVVIDLEKLNSGFGFINIITNDKKQIFRIMKEGPTSSTQKKLMSYFT